MDLQHLASAALIATAAGTVVLSIVANVLDRRGDPNDPRRLR